MKSFKKSLFLPLLSLSLATYSQQDFKPEYQVGIHAGATLSSMRFSPEIISQGQKLGYTSGVSFRYLSERFFGIQTELSWSQYGWMENNVESLNQYSRTLNVVELPFLSHIFFGMGKWGRFFVNLGPQISYILSDSEVSNYVDSKNKLHGKEVENHFNYGIVGGLGFEIMSKVGSFGMDGRYHFGLSDIFSNAKKEPFQSSSPQVITARLYYMYRF